jgi:superfamily II DNA or RNA helicase
MPVATIYVKDEVNVRIKGLDQDTFNKVSDRLSFFVPNYQFMDKVRLGWWDGKIKLVTQSGKTYLNLIEDIEPILLAAGYDFDIQDSRADYSHITNNMPIVDDQMFADYQMEGKPVVLYDYQVAAVQIALREGRGILEMATGAGKTLTCAALAKIYSQFGNVVIIVPTTALVLQTQSKFKKVGLPTGIWFGEIKDKDIITIATWQSLDHFPELFDGVVCVINDETHDAKAEVLSEILKGPGANVPFRFGCTGTMPESDIFRYQIKGSIGPIIFSLQTWELQERGLLAQNTIHQVVLQDAKNPEYKNKKDDIVEWSDELNWMFNNTDRVKVICDLIIDQTEKDGNSLILIQYKKHGKLLEEFIKALNQWYPTPKNIVSLDGDDKAKARIEEFENVNQTDNNILICTFGVASTGVDIPRIFNLFIIEPGAKFEKVMQSLGRGLRISSDKHALNTFDISGTAKFSKKHAAKRAKMFKDAKQDIEVIEVNY